VTLLLLVSAPFRWRRFRGALLGLFRYRHPAGFDPLVLGEVGSGVADPHGQRLADTDVAEFGGVEPQAFAGRAPDIGRFSLTATVGWPCPEPVSGAR
jgi:hypothetical protein